MAGEGAAGAGAEIDCVVSDAGGDEGFAARFALAVDFAIFLAFGLAADFSGGAEEARCWKRGGGGGSN